MMDGQLGNIVFIVWRESIEALLVIGILNAWLSQQGVSAGRGRLFLWAGVAAGAVTAFALGAGLISLGDQLEPETMELYQTGLVLLAAVLIVQMVFWMRKQGRTLKRDLEGALQGAADRNNWWGVFALAAIAVAREGSETVVFLAGTISAARNGALGMTIGAAALGLATAVATYAVLQLGGRYLSWRTFFRITETMLLLLAGALLVTATDKLIGIDVLPVLSGRLWDSSFLVPDSGPIGGLIAALTGYRAKPDLVQVLVLALYWAAMLWFLRPKTANGAKETKGLKAA
jgi:high-affinity iron transporter